MGERIGIDLGGTKIEGVLLDPDGEVVARLRRPTPSGEGYDAILGALTQLIGDLAAQSSSANGTPRLGIGTPGSLSPVDGLMRNSNTACLNGRSFREDLERLVGRDFAIANDANCFALAEARLGAGMGSEWVFGVILGTGVGGGIVHSGRIRNGRLGIAGEWGHQTLIRDGRPCFCGRRGCIETCLSGPSLEASYQRYCGRETRLVDAVAEFDSDPTDPNVIAWREEFLELFGMALGNVINLLDPDIIVLGGGVSNIDWLYDEGIERVQRNIFSDRKDTPIVRHSLGDSAGVFGAALLDT